MSKIDFMRTYLKVVEKGSLKAAAKDLNISVSTVSFQINSLEKLYGAKLLNRNVSGVSLTDEGIIAKKNMESILGDIEETKKLIDNLREDKVTILSGMVGLNMIFHLQSLLKAKYPSLEVNVDFKGAHECIKMLSWGKADFVIAGDITESVKSDKFNITEVGKDWLVLVTPPDHPLNHKKEVFIEDLIEYPLISLTEDYGIATSVRKALEKSGYHDLEPSLTVGDFFLQLNSISSNYGIGITSMIASSKAYEIGMVNMRPIKDLEDMRSAYLVTSNLASQCEKMGEYLEFMTDNLKKMFKEYLKVYQSLDSK
ncbi:MAG: LysR substrate-binding domain-containing protein [Halobacteriota archaeon]